MAPHPFHGLIFRYPNSVYREETRCFSTGGALRLESTGCRLECLVCLLRDHVARGSVYNTRSVDQDQYDFPGWEICFALRPSGYIFMLLNSSLACCIGLIASIDRPSSSSIASATSRNLNYSGTPSGVALAASGRGPPKPERIAQHPLANG